MLLIQTAQVVVIYGNDLYQQFATVEKHFSACNFVQRILFSAGLSHPFAFSYSLSVNAASSLR